MAGNDKFALTNVLDVIIYDKVTNKPVLYLDTLQKVTLETTAEKAEIKGGQGNGVLYSYDFGKTCKASIDNALLSPKSFQLISNNSVTTSVTKIDMRQDTVWEAVDGFMEDKGSLYPLTASASGAIELAFTPNEVASNILVYDIDNEGGTPLSAGTLVGKTLTNVAWANKKVVVYYSFNTNDETETYTISTDKFPDVYRLVGKTVMPNIKTGKKERLQVEIPSFKFDADMNLNFQAGDPQPFSMNGQVLKADNSNNMIVMKKWNTRIKI